MATVKIAAPANTINQPTVAAIGGAPGNVAFTIPTGTALSDVIDLRENYRLAGFIMDAAWTAAVITVRGSADGITFFDVYNPDGTEYTITVAAAHLVKVAVLDLMMLRYIQLRSGTGAAPVNQLATRNMVVLASQ
jgi:hypothetical protein